MSCKRVTSRTGYALGVVALFLIGALGAAADRFARYGASARRGASQGSSRIAGLHG